MLHNVWCLFIEQKTSWYNSKWINRIWELLDNFFLCRRNAKIAVRETIKTYGFLGKHSKSKEHTLQFLCFCFYLEVFALPFQIPLCTTAKGFYFDSPYRRRRRFPSQSFGWVRTRPADFGERCPSWAYWHCGDCGRRPSWQLPYPYAVAVSASAFGSRRSSPFGWISLCSMGILLIFDWHSYSWRCFIRFLGLTD